MRKALALAQGIFICNEIKEKEFYMEVAGVNVENWCGYEQKNIEDKKLLVYNIGILLQISV